MNRYKQAVTFCVFLLTATVTITIKSATTESINEFIDTLWPEDGDLYPCYPIPTRENIFLPKDMVVTDDTIEIIETSMCDVQKKLPTFLKPHYDGRYHLPSSARRALLTENPVDDLYEHAFAGNVLACAILITRSANVNHQSMRHLNNTALHAACNSPMDNYNTIHFLLMHGALADLTNSTGDTPLHIACERGHHATTKVLLLHKAALNIRNNHYKDTPLHTACRHGHCALVARLLKHKADTTVVDRVGHTALDLAIAHGHKLIIDLFRAHRTTE